MDKFFVFAEQDYWSQIVNSGTRRKLVGGLGALNFAPCFFPRTFSPRIRWCRWELVDFSMEADSQGNPGSFSHGARTFCACMRQNGICQRRTRIYTCALAARPLSPTLYILTAHVACRYRLTFRLPTRVSTFNCCQ